MENKTPLKRDKNLIWLSRDHHKGLLIVWKIRQGFRFDISNTRISDFVVNVFRAELEPHFEEEEDLLFIKLPEKDQLRIKAENEHNAIRKMAETLKHNPEIAGKDLEAFANLLEAHIRFEERILFPQIEKEISREALEIIGKQLDTDHKNKKLFECPDEFWIRNKQTGKG